MIIDGRVFDSEMDANSYTRGNERMIRVAALRLGTGLQEFQPWQNTPYGEMDTIFAIDVASQRRLTEEKP